MAQATGSAAQLEIEAARALNLGTRAQCLRAANLWLAAADQYTKNSWTADLASALRNASRSYSCAGDQKSALSYLGRAVDLENPMASYQTLVLLDDSPLYDPATRGVAEDARFVGEVNDLLRTLNPATKTTVTSAEEAQTALEDLVGLRLATIAVRAESGRVDVDMRRYRYALTDTESGGPPWERITTDVTLRRPPAAYHFRYRSPTTGRDTTMMYRCADGCTVVVH